MAGPVPPDSDTGTGPGTPLWVKIFGIIALVLILLVVIVLLVGGGHGPGRHSMSSSIIESSLQLL